MKKNQLDYKRIFRFVFAFLCVCMLGSSLTVTAFAADTLSLKNAKSQVNARFEMNNILPGDTKTQEYDIQVKFTGEELHYKITASLDTGAGNEYQGKTLVADFLWWYDEEKEALPAGEEGILIRRNVVMYIDVKSGDKDLAEALGLMVSVNGQEEYNGWMKEEPTIIYTLSEKIVSQEEADSMTSGGLTGDAAPIALLCMILMGSAVMFIYFGKNRNGNGTMTKLSMSIIMVILLVVALAITTFAFAYNVLQVDDNLFVTGEVSINVNDGVPLMGDEELLFEPGMTIQKNFFIENDGTCDIYYKLYAVGMEKNPLSEKIEVTVMDRSTVIYEGVLADMELNDSAYISIIREAERKDLTVSFRFPKDGGNSLQDYECTFDIRVDAVQVRNNPGREFE